VSRRPGGRLGRLVAALRPRPQPARHLDGPHSTSLQKTFSDIYADGTWTDAIPGMPRSGRGALYERSQPVAAVIRELVADGEVRSIVDVGCGDLTWISEVDEVTAGAVRYLGIDIVAALIEEHRRLPWGRFIVGDATAPRFRVDADLVLVKDMMFHLTDEQVALALDNLAASAWRLLILTCSDTPGNEDREFDRWHFAPLDLTKAPYSLRPWRTIDRPDGGMFAVFRHDSFAWPPRTT
jgi:SAM-dependent methyltransferase